MADLSFSVGLDDKQFASALERMERKATKTGVGITSALSKGGRGVGGMGGYLSSATAGVDKLSSFARQAPGIARGAGAVLLAKLAYDQATKSAAAFAKGNDDAARALKGTSGAAASFASSAGPAAYGVMLGIRSRLDDVARSAEGAMTSLSKFGLDLFGGAGTYDDIKKAVNEGKELQKRVAELKASKLDRDRLRPLIGAGIEDAKLGQLSVYDQPDAKHRAGMARSALEEKRAIDNLLRETSKLTAIEKEHLGVNQLIDEINKRGSFQRSAMAIAEQDRIAKEQAAADEKTFNDARELAGARQSLVFGQREYELSRLKLSGNDDAADALAREIELQKKLYDISQGTVLNEQDKAVAMAIAKLQAEDLAAIEKDRALSSVSSTRTVGGAIGNAGVFEQVFSAASGAVSGTQIELSKRSNQTLEQIRGLMSQFVNNPPGAVFQ